MDQARAAERSQKDMLSNLIDPHRAIFIEQARASVILAIRI
jgi:hypothetical protein